MENSLTSCSIINWFSVLFCSASPDTAPQAVVMRATCWLSQFATEFFCSASRVGLGLAEFFKPKLVSRELAFRLLRIWLQKWTFHGGKMRGSSRLSRHVCCRNKEKHDNFVWLRDLEWWEAGSRLRSTTHCWIILLMTLNYECPAFAYSVSFWIIRVESLENPESLMAIISSYQSFLSSPTDQLTV